MRKQILIRSILVMFAMGIVFLLTMHFTDIGTTTVSLIIAERDSKTFRPTAQETQSVVLETNDRFLPLVSSFPDSVFQSSDEQTTARTIESLHEIAARISEQQYTEGQNELDALIKLIDPMSDEEKLSLLEEFIAYSQNNVFNPEVVTAFDTLWNSLNMEQVTRIDSAEKLAKHYANTYEFMFALEQFHVLAKLEVPLGSALLRDLSYSQFSLGDYINAIPNLLQHINMRTEQGDQVDRREYSMLFESYYRTGDFKSAQMIGALLLNHYNDIQDWKDMQQFYLSVSDETGLEEYLESARKLGLMNDRGEWISSL